MHTNWIYQNTTEIGPEFSSGMSKGNLLIWKAFQTEKMVGTCEILGKERQIKYVCLYYTMVSFGFTVQK